MPESSAKAELFLFLREEEVSRMRNVYDCVEAFEKLRDKEYHLVVGRKK